MTFFFLLHYEPQTMKNKKGRQRWNESKRKKNYYLNYGTMNEEPQYMYIYINYQGFERKKIT